MTIFIVLFLLTSCKQNTLEENIIENTIDEETNEVSEPVYVDDNPITVGLYQNGKFVTSLDTPFIDGVDIGSFDVYFTNTQNTGSTNTKNNFNKYKNEYENIDNYKIGFYIGFETNQKKYEATITKPDIYATTPYIYNYLYDDINVLDGAWYSHVEENDVTDNTIYSSIKLYAAEKTSEIVSPITLTVFTYDTQDDFDDNGNYRGNSKYTITINRK